MAIDIPMAKDLLENTETEWRRKLDVYFQQEKWIQIGEKAELLFEFTPELYSLLCGVKVERFTSKKLPTKFALGPMVEYLKAYGAEGYYYAVNDEYRANPLTGERTMYLVATAAQRR